MYIRSNVMSYGCNFVHTNAYTHSKAFVYRCPITSSHMLVNSGAGTNMFLSSEHFTFERKREKQIDVSVSSTGQSLA